jgi:glycosyltransferase involved in cell wall biosynthesis
MTPAVSVICTVKDAQFTVVESLESVRAQSLADWEMVIVDDGSSDETPRLVADAIQNDPRFRLIITAGVGRARALNMALRESRSKLIANIDADDLFHPEHLRTTVEVFNKQPDYVMICSAVIFIIFGQKYSWPNEPHIPANSVTLRDISAELRIRNPICHSSVVAKRDDLINVGGYNEGIPSQFDYDLWVRLAEKGNRIGMLELPLVAKRIHSEQSFESRNRRKYVMHSIHIQIRAIRVLKGSWYHWGVAGLRLMWCLLPRRLRFWLKPSV